MHIGINNIIYLLCININVLSPLLIVNSYMHTIFVKNIILIQIDRETQNKIIKFNHKIQTQQKQPNKYVTC